AKEDGRVSAEGSDTHLGAGCRAFESHYSDQMSSGVKTPGGFFFVYCSAIPDVISGPLYSQFFLLLNGNQSHSRLTGLSLPICYFFVYLNWEHIKMSRDSWRLPASPRSGHSFTRDRVV